MYFVCGTPTPLDTPIGSFQHTTHIFINLDNQKNDIRGDTVFHFQSKSSESFYVRSGVNIFLRLQEQGCDPSTPVSEYSSPQGLRSVSASIIIAVVRSECRRVGDTQLGFFPEDAGAHSLCSGGDTSMHIDGVPDQTLMAIGWWRLLGFIVYIQQQISSFSTGVSVRMSDRPWFQHL